MKKTIRLTESDLIRMIKKVLNEQAVPKDKVINLFCQNQYINDSFREYDLTFVNDEDVRGGINGGGYKTIEMAPNPNTPRQEYEGTSVLMDVVPSKLINKDFAKTYKLDISQNQMFLLIHKSQKPYFCKIEDGTDDDWKTYLNSL